MDIYKQVVRRLLFRLDPETAHNLAKSVFRHPCLSAAFASRNSSLHDKRLQADLGRIKLANPVGLGAGFDKDCEMVNSLQRLGFGYIVVGSVMFNVRPGNPRPRMVRDLEGQGLFNCMGLPSKGLAYAVLRLKRRIPTKVPLIINFNAETFEEYLRCTEVLDPLGDAIEISLFCPNRGVDEGAFLEPHRARTLIEEVAKRTEKPIFVKLPGYASDDERRKRFDLIGVLVNCQVEGITVAPKILVKHNALSVGQGTRSGKPAFEKMLRMVREVFEVTNGRCHIKATGGIFSAQDAFEAIAAGATVVEIVTAFGFEGWRVADNINQGLIRLLDKSGIANVSALRGANTNTSYSSARQNSKSFR